MKKSITLLLLLSFVLTGCQNVVGEAPTINTQQQSESVENSSIATDDPTENETTLSSMQETKPQEAGSQSPTQAGTATEPTEPATEQPSKPAHREESEPETGPTEQTPIVTPETQPSTEGETVPTTVPTEGETEPTELQQEPINIAAIESGAEAYAASLGFVVDNSIGKGTAGYYPPDYRPYASMQDSLDAAIGLVSATKNQLNSRFSAEHSDVLVEGAYGLARVNCQVVFSHSDELGDWYYIYVFYG